jgi:hypothetical protein
MERHRFKMRYAKAQMQKLAVEASILPYQRRMPWSMIVKLFAALWMHKLGQRITPCPRCQAKVNGRLVSWQGENRKRLLQIWTPEACGSCPRNLLPLRKAILKKC